jgi:two-component system sensor histidine kinase FlrB
VLSFAIEAHATELAFVVADSGPGIPESARAQIFAPFFTTKAEGTGLGLAVARDLASAHGGRVALLETSGAGTRLALILPRVSTPPVAPAGEVRA